MLELINPTKPTAGTSWFLIAALSTSDEMLPPGKDLILATKAIAGEFTHPSAGLTFKSCHLSALSRSSKDEGQKGFIKPHSVTNHTPLSQLSPHALSLTGTVRPHNTSHSQGIHSSHLQISKCTVTLPDAVAVCILWLPASCKTLVHLDFSHCASVSPEDNQSLLSCRDWESAPVYQHLPELTL